MGFLSEYPATKGLICLDHLHNLPVVMVGYALHQIKPVECLSVESSQLLVDLLRKTQQPPDAGMAIRTLSPVGHNMQMNPGLTPVFTPRFQPILSYR